MPRIAGVKNTNNFTGGAMGVLLGVILVLVPWFTQLGFLKEIGLTLVGIALIVLSLR